MNKYTPVQLEELFKILVSSNEIPSFAVKTFISDDSDFVTINIKVCKEDHVIYNRMNNFRWTKITGNYPTKERKFKMKKIKEIIFEAPIKRVPLFINDEMLRPILIWRLKNNL
jgi:hypothetical protein